MGHAGVRSYESLVTNRLNVEGWTLLGLGAEFPPCKGEEGVGSAEDQLNTGVPSLIVAWTFVSSSMRMARGRGPEQRTEQCLCATDCWVEMAKWTTLGCSGSLRHYVTSARNPCRRMACSVNLPKNRTMEIQCSFRAIPCRHRANVIPLPYRALGVDQRNAIGRSPEFCRHGALVTSTQVHAV